ncbi:MAG: hypothetical protein GTN62_01855 [Gemmatimonadales bacterium]|nr:hypothetical protein [Gemmatimonadales bacterium]NIN12308.1 hypothetical protein [Gemmatimonadales bacterium]NIN48846.1 hypothetical protein [Gemmatimonadales bacterium]NIP06310.1 hypothetical protein [Gemmatimonadales bacterium]NIR00682.1 hypothetical protein [Gemmatimonadales bacterium]
MNAATRLAITLLLFPGSLSAQGFLEQFSYEGLRFSGIGFEFGVVASDRLTAEPTGALRIDYGFIGPKVRVLIGASYFKGDFNADEVSQFETRLRGVVQDPTGDFDIDVGTITWADLEAALDLQYVLQPDGPVNPYFGFGLGVHIRDGDGVAIDETFVEDALDTIAAGLTLSLGVEIAVARPFYFTTDIRGEVTSELRTVAVRGGFMYRIPRGGGE